MLAVGDLLFDPATRRVFRGQEERRLSPKAADVFLTLAEMPGQMWSRDALLERVWPRVHVGEEVLTHAIAELRRAFADDFRTPRYLATVHKSGYRLLCAVQTVEPERLAKFELDPNASMLDVVSATTPNVQSGLVGIDTYARYLEAIEYYERGGRQNTLAAVALFSALLSSNPNFALAHVGLAKAMTFLGTYYGTGDWEAESALEHCALAHKIVSRSPEAFAAEGLIFALRGDFARSVERFGLAIAFRPNSAETHYLLGRSCLAELEFSLAATMFERAAALRADDYHSLILAGKARQKSGSAKRAFANFALALPRIESRLIADDEDYRALCAKARALWQLGRPDEASALMDRIAAHPDPMNYHLACTFARAGEQRRAMDVLEEVIDLGWRHGAWLERDPDLDDLRGERRFKRIAASVGAAG